MIQKRLARGYEVSKISSSARTSDGGKRKSYQQFDHPCRNYDQDERSAFARVNIKRTGLVGETVTVYQRLRLPSTTSPMASLASTLGERGSNRGEGTRGYSLHWLLLVLSLPVSSGYCRTLPAMEQMERLSSRLRSRGSWREDSRIFRFQIPRNNWGRNVRRAQLFRGSASRTWSKYKD